MSKYDVKMKALEVLKEAIDAVNAATEAIDDFAEEYGLEPEEAKMTVSELAELVSAETGMKESCVYTALATAFDLMRDLDLTVVEDEDDDE